jgi:hypothetical protein
MVSIPDTVNNIEGAVYRDMTPDAVGKIGVDAAWRILGSLVRMVLFSLKDGDFEAPSAMQLHRRPH